MKQGANLNQEGITMKLHASKIGWILRAILAKPFFGTFCMPSYIGKPVFLEGRRNIHLGRHVRIFPGIRMEAIGTGQIQIGNNVAIEQNVHITSMGGILQIGSDVTIAANAFITNLDHEYTNVNISVMNQGHILKDTQIGDGCFIGYGAAIQAGTVLGKHCIVGTNAVVGGHFPDYSVIVGIPAKAVKRYNENTNSWEKLSSLSPSNPTPGS